MKPTSILRSLVAVAATLHLFSASLQAFTDEEIAVAGQEALSSFQATLVASPGDHGFRSGDEVRALTLGSGVPVCLLDAERLETYRAEDALDGVLMKPRTWYFPVKLGQETRALLSITVLKGTQKLVPEAFGKVGLAKNLDVFLQAYPASDLQLVLGNASPDVFLHIRSLKRPNLSPISGDEADLKIFLQQPADALPVLEALRAR